MKALLKKHRLLIKQFLKFGIVGTLGFIVDISVLKFCMVFLGMGPYLGRVFSFLLGATTTWICNRVFTFSDRRHGHMGMQWAKFLIVCAVGFTLNYGTYAALISLIPYIYLHPVLGVAAGSLTAMFFNFFMVRTLVFR